MSSFSRSSTLWSPLQKGRKEGNVLFNDALSSFYLRLYGVGARKERNVLFNNALSTLYLRLYGVGARKERNVLFNNALNTFYLRLYGVRHMVKDHSLSERGNPLPSHRLLFPITVRVLLYALSHRQDDTYHNCWYTSRGALAGTRNSSMGPPHEGSIQRPLTP